MFRIDFGIGPQQRLLLRAVFAPDIDSATAAIEEWWRGVRDFDEVRGTDAGLFPQIYWRLRSRVRDPVLARRLKGSARHHWVRNQYVAANCGKLLDVLSKAGIRVLLMKGAAIAATVDHDVGLRQMSDCDVLVERGKAGEVLRLLVASGHVEAARIDAHDVVLTHGLTLFQAGTQIALFDLHWRPFRSIGALEIVDELFGHALPARFADRDALAPCFEHLIFHAIVHGTDWSPSSRYDWLVDTIKIFRRSERRLDWERLADIARRYRYGDIVAAALAAAHEIADVDVPNSVLRRLTGTLLSFGRREMRLRRTPPSQLSTADELFLGLTTAQRADAAALRRPVLAAIPRLARLLLGTPFSTRSLIGDDPKAPVTLLYGWSAPEPHGRWTEGRFASVALYSPPGEQLPGSLKLTAHSLPVKSAELQTVTVFAGLQKLGCFHWSPARPDGAQQLLLPASIWHHGTAVLRFDIGSRHSPLEMGLSGDSRMLGICVQELTLVPPRKDACAAALDLSSSGHASDILWSGWSRPEAQGCWTLGGEAVLRWRVSTAISPGSVLVIANSMSAPGGRPVIGSYRLGTQAPIFFSYPAAAADLAARIVIDKGIAAGEELAVAIVIHNPRAPADVGKSLDRRVLGLHVQTVRIMPPESNTEL